MPRKHLVPSIIIVVVLGLQLSTFVTGSRVWPWMSYGMYAFPNYAPVRYREPRAYVLFDDGQRMDVDHTTLGLGLFAYKDTLLLPMVAGDLDAALQVESRVEARTGRDVAEVRLEVHVYIAENGQISEQVNDRPVKLDAAEAASETAVEP